ncbi:MAG: spermidine/putrescine ABC transporter substrate-binding protein [Deltaproteobacteria bacterium]|jgi:spermidine/putrescine transport system substrate-binding protein|nr:spermidine/putrescine ABC transporter substrate-binding protein [Deltaproteobacteria bacterium]
MSKKRTLPLLAGILAVLALFLAGCGDSGEKKPAASAGQGQSQAGGEPASSDEPRKLNIFIWSEYIDPDVVAEFEKAKNVKVRLDLYESNEEMIAALQTGRKGAYDLIVPTTYFLPSLISMGLIEPLNHSLLPNMANLDPRFTTIEEDPGNKYAIPYQWGTSGLIVRSDDPDSIDPSWSLLFEESASQGNFLLFDTARDALGSALFYLGYSPNTTDINEIREAGELLIKIKNRPNFMGFNGGVDGLSKVVSKVAAIAQVYNGEAVKATFEEQGIYYVTPKEGCEIWLDLFAIPAGAENAAVAHEFLNFIMEPEIAARLADYSMYATPNLKALDLVKREDRANPAIYPSDELVEGMEFYRDLGEASRLYEETWTIVKSR